MIYVLFGVSFAGHIAGGLAGVAIGVLSIVAVKFIWGLLR
tara:strand:+ start:38 stop:157 length:120 start_codon:yes stop_codon:yes gene_type:complete